ncbi:hypothetical protein XELAEV_18029191mg [Xenopus laevis]|uniref:Uncharacterized protein n=1 Tax=Xenopus laevis TaxID=8355 RepID=A0A974CQW8_XENLA|nr:hypothetical protein XELAEV_18029191mg [Xenopus laevis]
MYSTQLLLRAKWNKESQAFGGKPNAARTLSCLLSMIQAGLFATSIKVPNSGKNEICGHEQFHSLHKDLH